MVGRSVRCPQCSATITIPDPTVAGAAVEVIPIVDAYTSAEIVDEEAEDVRQQLEPNLQNDSLGNKLPSFSTDNSSEVVQQTDDEIEDINLGDRPPMDEEMDMTPMVDVTFLLLIFFMVTASFASEKVIQQKTTKKNAASASPVQVVDILTIRIDDLNTFLVMLPDQTEVDASNKQDLLIALGNARREGLLDDVENVKVEAHEASIHSALVAALDSCRTEGLSNFQVKVVEDFD